MPNYRRVMDGMPVTAAEAVDANNCIRPGYAANFAIDMWDSKQPRSTTGILTDTEQAFSDSPEGAAHVAHARYKHELGERHKGDRAAPWTDAHAAEAARRGACDKARLGLAVADQIARAPALQANAHAAQVTAAAMRDERLRTGYKRQG